MPTYLLTWKPKRWDWKSFDTEIRELRTKGRVRLRWSVGRNMHVQKRDRVFLLRQGVDRPGIIGAGRVIKGSYRDKHWDPKRLAQEALFTQVRMDSLLNPEQDRILRRESLDFGPPRLWSSQSSGTTIPSETAAELERRWTAHLRKIRRAPLLLPEEIQDDAGFPEGGKRSVVVNQYERDPRNRAACIAIYGHKCSVCGFDFGQTYGELGRNFIHVHHIISLANRSGQRRKINPRKDLRPVCPNCHAMLHIGGATRRMEELRGILQHVANVQKA